MQFKIKSTALPHGYAENSNKTLFIVYFCPKTLRTKDSASGFDYPHISLSCTNLTRLLRAYGEEISFVCDDFHVSFSSSKQVYFLLTAQTHSTNHVIITKDNSKESATLGVDAVVKKGATSDTTWTADDVCEQFLLPILNGGWQAPSGQTPSNPTTVSNLPTPKAN